MGAKNLLEPHFSTSCWSHGGPPKIAWKAMCGPLFGGLCRKYWAMSTFTPGLLSACCHSKSQNPTLLQLLCGMTLINFFSTLCRWENAAFVISLMSRISPLFCIYAHSFILANSNTFRSSSGSFWFVLAVANDYKTTTQILWLVLARLATAKD